MYYHHSHQHHQRLLFATTTKVPSRAISKTIAIVDRSRLPLSYRANKGLDRHASKLRRCSFFHLLVHNTSRRRHGGAAAAAAAVMKTIPFTY
jgi:hypothetical protein